MDYFFDTYAIIEFTKDNPSYNKFKENVFITSALNIAEAHFILTNQLSTREADYLINKLNLSLLDLDKDVAIEASKFRFENRKLRMSYADCLGYVLSRKHGLNFVTGDDAFKNFDGVDFIK